MRKSEVYFSFGALSDDFSAKLKQKRKRQVLELEKPKRKHKFRAMTNGEYCSKWFLKHKYCSLPDGIERCPLFLSKACFKENANRPLVIDGKYTMIEVIE